MIESPRLDLPVQQIIDLYNLKGLSSIKIGAIYNVSHTAILDLLQRNGQKRKSIASYLKKYTENESYFELIDIPEKAYFLGFFFADGCNSKGNSTIVIKIGEKDKYILEKFRDSIKSNGKIAISLSKNPKHQNMSIFRIHSDKISRDLYKLGAGDNKSLTLKFPTRVPNHLLSHFVRGYFDGDGCISMAKQNPTLAHIAICLTQEFGEKLKEILLELNINSRVAKVGGIHRLDFGGRQQCIKFAKWLYKDANGLFLNRKYDRLKKLEDYQKIITPK